MGPLLTSQVPTFLTIGGEVCHVGAFPLCVVVESISVSGEPLPTEKEPPIGSKISTGRTFLFPLTRNVGGGAGSNGNIVRKLPGHGILHNDEREIISL